MASGPKLTLDSIRALQSQGTNALGRLRNGLDELRNGNFPSFGGADFAQTNKDKAAFSITAFQSQMLGRDIALTSHYRVTLNSPSAPRFISFAACQTSIPGYTVNTMEVRRYGVGPTYSYPVANINPEISISFYVDAGGDILRFFQGWANQVFNMNVSDAPDAPTHYVARYKSEYAVDLEIELLDRQKNPYFGYKLKKLYPTLIGNAELMWGDSQIFRLPVSFKYDSYETYSYEVTGAKTPVQGGILNDIRQAFNEAGEFYDTFQSIRGEIENTTNTIRNISFENIFPRG